MKLLLITQTLDPEDPIAAAPIARLAGTPTALWYHHRHVDSKLRLATALVDRVLSPTPEGFQLPTGKLVITGHGIDVERFSPLSESRLAGPLRVICPGR